MSMRDLRLAATLAAALLVLGGAARADQATTTNGQTTNGQATSGQATTADQGASGGESHDRYVGYYYPFPQTEETYVARAKTLAEATRDTRLAFVTALTQQQMTAPYPAGLAVFAKGGQSDKLIMVALRNGLFDSVYRMRGVLAMMTASARGTDLFKKYKVQDFFTFFDLLKMLGFKKLVLTNGTNLTHVVYIK